MKKYLLFCLMLGLIWPAAAQNSNKRYELKSGIAKTRSITGGQQTDGVICFDDYGAKETLTQTIVVPELLTYDSVVLILEDSQWVYSIVDGKAQTPKKSKDPMPVFNYLHPTERMIETNKFTEVGKDTFLGRPCKVYTYESTQGRRKSTWKVWVYKGFALKYEAKIGRRDVLFECLDLRENVSVPAKQFVIPSGK